jgi:hypothetical protein
MTMIATPVALGLAAAVAGPGLAAEPHGAVCRALVAQVRTLAADPAAFQRALATGDGLLAPLVASDKGGQVAPRFAAKVEALYGDNSDKGIEATLQPIQAGMWRAEKLEGTLHCADERFFAGNPDSDLIGLATPTAYGDLCWTSSRSMGTAAGGTALIETEQTTSPFEGLDVEITPWDRGWKPSCQASFRFTDRFVVSERLCGEGAVCAAAEPLAAKLAQAFARRPQGETLANVSPPSDRQAADLAGALAAAKTRFRGDDEAHGELPSFGRKPKTEYPEFSDTAATALIDLAGAPFIVRVGVGGVGWRPIGDDLVAIYRIAPTGPVPVASFVVQRQITGLKSAETSVPKPFVNTH